jgi:hypothetical protein
VGSTWFLEQMPVAYFDGGWALIGITHIVFPFSVGFTLFFLFAKHAAQRCSASTLRF